MIHALIVDDERRAREVVREIIKLYCPEITSVSEAASVSAALEAIHSESPDLLFLDIQLNKETGFDVVRQLRGKKPGVIFVTAYEEYAVQAFKVSALDYLLKPIDPDEFSQAVKRALQQKGEDRLLERMEEVMKSLDSVSQAPKKITLKTTDSIHIISVSDIVFCEADRNYTVFHMITGEKIMVSKAIGEYEELLPQRAFLRVHQSFLVNTEHIRRFDRETGMLIVANDKEVPVSTRKREQLIGYLSGL